MATGLSILFFLKTRTVAYGTLSCVRESISIPFTIVVCAVVGRAIMMVRTARMFLKVFIIFFAFVYFFAAKVHLIMIRSKKLSTTSCDFFDDFQNQA